jgi:diaminopimelate epimerase
MNRAPELNCNQEAGFLHIEFEKWHGCKNDFIVTWITNNDRDLIIPSLQRQAAIICDRSGGGISADGILVLLTKHSREPYPDELVIINSDGSLARNCGNGLRCAARSVLRKIATNGSGPGDMPPVIELKVAGRSFYCKVFGDKEFIGVDMGSTIVRRMAPTDSLFQEVQSAIDSLPAGAIKETGRAQAIYHVDVGNPHLILLGYEISAESLRRLAEPLQNLDFGALTSKQAANDPQGINIHAAWPGNVDDRSLIQAAHSMGISPGEAWEVRPWERGVGLTQACGSGAVATVSAIIADDDMGEPDGWTAVTMPGGHLFVNVAESNYTLAGPATLVFTGRLEI